MACTVSYMRRCNGARRVVDTLAAYLVWASKQTLDAVKLCHRDDRVEVALVELPAIAIVPRVDGARQNPFDIFCTENPSTFAAVSPYFTQFRHGGQTAAFKVAVEDIPDTLGLCRIDAEAVRAVQVIPQHLIASALTLRGPLRHSKADALCSQLSLKYGD